jgi:integrase
MNAILTLLKNDPAKVDAFSIEQIVKVCGDGKLANNSECSNDLRDYLHIATSENLFKYALSCLQEPFERSGYVLQDLVNEFGRRLSTAKSYLQIIENHIRPKWGKAFIAKVTAAQVGSWLKEIERSPVTKAHIKALLYRLFEKAMYWELLPVQRNPMELVEIRGSSKRGKRPLVLTVEQSKSLLQRLTQPYRTMVLVGLCTGLRVSEILALKWEDIDFEHSEMCVCRAVVRGIVDNVKTEYSEDLLPLDDDFSRELREWQKGCPQSREGWVFPSPVTGRPYSPGVIQQKIIREAGKKLGLSNVGWHTLRHTYRSLLDANGAPVGVQQRLMRHAEVSTTMNRYGSALMESKREANSNVVKMVLKKQVSEEAENGIVGFCGVEEHDTATVQCS